MRTHMIRSFIALAGLSAFTAIAANAYAGVTNIATGTVTSITLGAGGVFPSTTNTVGIAGKVSGVSTCSSTGAYVLPSLSTDQGKAVLNILNAALLSGKSVSVRGSGVCINLPGTPVTAEGLDSVALIQ